MKRSATRYINFTKKALESLPIPDGGRIVVYDEQEEGLGVRIETNGRRTFFWFKKVLRQTNFSIDRHRVRCFDRKCPRDCGKGWNVSILAKWKNGGYEEGKNPFERHEEPTFGELVDRYIERHIKLAQRKDQESQARRT